MKGMRTGVGDGVPAKIFLGSCIVFETFHSWDDTGVAFEIGDADPSAWVCGIYTGVPASFHGIVFKFAVAY